MPSAFSVAFVPTSHDDAWSVKSRRKSWVNRAPMKRWDGAKSIKFIRKKEIELYTKFILLQSEEGTTNSGSLSSYEADSDIENEIKQDPQTVTVPIPVCISIMIGWECWCVYADLTTGLDVVLFGWIYLLLDRITATSCWERCYSSLGRVGISSIAAISASYRWVV